MGSIVLNGLRFEAPEEWVFYPFEGIILGRHSSKQGTLQISRAFKNDLPSSATYSECVAVAEGFVEADGQVFDETSNDTGQELFGAFSCQASNVFKRVLYHFRNGELVLAVYQCEWEARENPDFQQRMLEAEAIIKTAYYEETV